MVYRWIFLRQTFFVTGTKLPEHGCLFQRIGETAHFQVIFLFYGIRCQYLHQFDGTFYVINTDVEKGKICEDDICLKYKYLQSKEHDFKE